jgi:hypothetical protein
MNLGSIINSANDEFGMCIHKSQLLGFFVTNRGGKKKDDDIFMFQNIDFDDILMQIEDQRSTFNIKIDEAEEDLNESLNEYFSKNENLDNTNVLVSGKCLDENIIPDLRIKYKIQVKDQKLLAGINVFSLTQYQLLYFELLNNILTVMKNHFEPLFNIYMKNSNKITVTINGNKDSFIFPEAIKYGGELGDQIIDHYYKNEIKHKVDIKINDELNQDRLAFLRAYAVKNFLINKIPTLVATNHEFILKVSEDSQTEAYDYSTIIQVDIRNGFGILQKQD